MRSVYVGISIIQRLLLLLQAGYGDGAAGLWVMLFTVSKVFELVDTFILVLKGKDPMFLHW